MAQIARPDSSLGRFGNHPLSLFAKFQSGKAILLQNLEAKWSFKLCLTYCSLTMMMKMIIMIIEMIMMIRMMMMILRQNYHLSNNPRDHPTKPNLPSTTETNVYR